MTENLGKWPSGHRKTEKSGHRLAAEKTLFPRRWYGGYDLRKPGGHLGNVGWRGFAAVAGSIVMKSARFEVDTELFPFESRTVELRSGATIHFNNEGQGPLLLLLHGNLTWSFLYRNIVWGLKDRFRCIAPDYPGFGLSIAPAGYGFTAAEHATVMAEFVEALDLRDFTIMMQDWGGPIGFLIALRHPDRVRGLIIGNTFAWPLERFGQKMFSRILGGPPGSAELAAIGSHQQRSSCTSAGAGSSFHQSEGCARTTRPKPYAPLGEITTVASCALSFWSWADVQTTNRRRMK